MYVYGSSVRLYGTHCTYYCGFKQLHDIDRLERSDKSCRVLYNSQKFLPEEIFASFATCSHWRIFYSTPIIPIHPLYGLLSINLAVKALIPNSEQN